MLLHDALVHHARVHSRRIALATEAGDVSYGALLDRVRHYAGGLARLGVQRGDRVAVLSRNTAPYVGLLFAVTRLRAVLVPLNHLFVPREHTVVLRDAAARFLLFAEEYDEVVDAVRRQMPGALECVRIERGGGGYDGLPEGPRGDVLLPADYASPSPSDVALQLYKSGITSTPRGAMLTHANLAAASVSAALELGLSRRDVFLSSGALPLMGAIGGLLRFLYVGATIVLHPEFGPEEVLRTVERKKITHLLLTPAMIARILGLPSAERFNLATLRTVLYGGSAVSLDPLKRAIRFFRCGMVQSYGQFESTGVLSFLDARDHSLEEGAPYARRLVSVGKEAIGVELRVVNEDGSPAAPGAAGEVIARGRNVFAGYHGDPGLTAEVLRDGWLRTGDMASRDEEGYLYLLDRKRDTLLVGGISVCPREIETVIGEHPAVSEAAVVALPDYVLGEVPVAVVSLRQGREADADLLLAHCRRNMAPFKVPRLIEFLPSLPRNSAGKVLKVKLKERLANGDLVHRTPGR